MYGVRYVSDDALPADLEWAIVPPSRAGRGVLFVKRSAASEQVLSEASTAYQRFKADRGAA